MAIYVIIGLAVGVLLVTGYLMYWNRYLSKRVRRWRAEPRRRDASAAVPGRGNALAE